MDKQTKIIIGLLIFIMVLTMIFVLKVTGVVKPICYNQFLSVEGIGIIKFEITPAITLINMKSIKSIDGYYCYIGFIYDDFD